MSASPTMLRLAPRRLDQLKAIAAKLDLSVSETIAHMIRQQIDAGVIPDAIPGFSIRKRKSGVVIQIDDGETATVSRETALKIVEALRSVSSGGPGVVDVSPFKAADSFAITKQGTGIKVQVPFHGETAKRWNDAPALTADLARDLARVIEEAAR